MKKEIDLETRFFCLDILLDIMEAYGVYSEEKKATIPDEIEMQYQRFEGFEDCISRVVHKLLAHGFSIEEIAEYLDLTTKQINWLIEKQKFLSKWALERKKMAETLHFPPLRLFI